jgi:hypothetical protein
VEVVETSPTGKDVDLGLNENFSLKIAYDTDEPVNIWARPFFKGKEVDAMSNASVKHEGKGFALGWFSFNEPAEVDEVRILVGRDGQRHGELVLTYPVTIRAGSASPGEPDKPQWISQLIDQDEAARRQISDEAAARPITAGDVAFLSGFMLSVLALLTGGIIAPVVAFWRWSGAWRVAAALPGFLLVLVILRIVIDTSIDPTSHNLWPFEILVSGAVSLGLIAVMAAVRFIMRRTGALYQ